MAAMPRLWDETIESHRAAVREATLDTTAALVSEQGLTSVTMSQIAQETGIGRATLYKYFADVEAILLAWHERQIKAHLDQLAKARDQAPAAVRLERVLETYALTLQERPNNDLAAHLHEGEHMNRAQEHLNSFIRELVSESADAGRVRTDVKPEELAKFCLGALSAANGLRSRAAVRRLVTVTLAGLRPAS
jgi:AcrR family transcriptional regulator